MSIGTTQVDKHRNCIIVEILDPCYDAFGDECQEKLVDQIADALGKLGSDIVIRKVHSSGYRTRSHSHQANVIDQGED